MRSVRVGWPVVLLTLLLGLPSLPVTAVAQSGSDVTTMARAVAPSPTPGPVAAQSAPLRVLFIGNSHTYVNGGVAWHVGRLAESEDPPRPFVGESATISAATLEEHWQLDSQGRIPFGDYDVVVLQGHIPVSDDPTAASFLEYARKFDDIIRQSGARTVFFMTWPHPDHPAVKLRDIVRAHRGISAELGADVAPVAIAFREAQHDRPDLELIGPDGVHANWAGTYLASAVLYATILHRSPVGSPYTYGVSDEDAAYLQRLAWRTVTRWQEGDRRD